MDFEIEPFEGHVDDASLEQWEREWKRWKNPPPKSTPEGFNKFYDEIDPPKHPDAGTIVDVVGENVAATSKDINVLVLLKGEEQYAFLFDNESTPEVLRLFGKYASNPEFSFSWYDAAILSKKIRQSAKRTMQERDARR